LSRHEYYQKPEEVVVTIFAKGIPAENVAVEFGEQIVCLFNRCQFDFPLYIHSIDLLKFFMYTLYILGNLLT
jgi:hypothetical protein